MQFSAIYQGAILTLRPWPSSDPGWMCICAGFCRRIPHCPRGLSWQSGTAGSRWQRSRLQSTLMLMLHREAVSSFTFLYSIRLHWERLGAGSIWQWSRLQGLLLPMLHEFAMAVRQCMPLFAHWCGGHGLLHAEVRYVAIIPLQHVGRGKEGCMQRGEGGFGSSPPSP